MMGEMFEMVDRMFADAMKEMDGIIEHMNAELDDIKEKAAKGEIKIRNFVMKGGKLVELPMVPTTDRISFTKKPVRTDMPAKTVKTEKTPVKKHQKSVFSEAEQKKIRSLRKGGWSIKDIAKEIHRDDKAVSAFVRGK